MSEDSIASDSISFRTDANAPLLPPRKRLLAGLKQNGWSSPSSSSCAAAPVEPPQVIETLAHISKAKPNDLDQNSVDAADRGSLQSLNDAAESLDSQNIGPRNPKRQREASLLTMKKSSKKKKKVVLEADGHLVDDFIEPKVSSLSDKVKASGALSFSSEKVKDEADVDAVASKISSVIEKHSNLADDDVLVQEKEERVNTANGEATLEHPINAKPGSNGGSGLKEEEEVTCDEVRKSSRSSARRIKKDNIRVATVDDTQKRRRNPNRQNHKKAKEAEQKKHEMQRDKMSQMPLLADEELARQLHRAMNSSPRIARCLSHKEERPLLAPNGKRFPGS